MQGRSTELLPALPAGAWSRFVLFPLPAGNAEYAHYVDDVVKLLPAKDLQTTVLNGHPFVTAPICDLPLLFPPGPLAAGDSILGKGAPDATALKPARP
jgi:hypothetical protein